MPPFEESRPAALALPASASAPQPLSLAGGSPDALLQPGSHGGLSVFLTPPSASEEAPRGAAAPPTEPLSADAQALLAAAADARADGNALFARCEWEAALARYEQALARLALPALAARPEANAAALACRCNAAAAALRLGRAGEAEAHCSRALALQPGAPKALFRRAQARLALGAARGALADARAAAAAAPGDAAAARLLEEAEAAAEAATAQAGGEAAPAAAESATNPDAEEAEAALGEEEQRWLEGLLEEVSSALAAGPASELATEARLLHLSAQGAEAAAIGRVLLSGAAASASSLQSAAAFVRGQHVAASAAAAALLLPRAALGYPQVPWACAWPEKLDVEADGAFVELHVRGQEKGAGHTAPRTFFVPAGGGEAVRLPPDCALLLGPSYSLLA